MYLSLAITKAESVAEFRDIFAKNVEITLGCMNDVVTVDGYEGSVSTDVIANKVIGSFSNAETEDGSKQLATLLATKVFIPLKTLVESRRNRCSSYQLIALTRIEWAKSPSHEFGRSVALKHAMVLGFLDKKYRNGW